MGAKIAQPQTKYLKFLQLRLIVKNASVNQEYNSSYFNFTFQALLNRNNNYSRCTVSKCHSFGEEQTRSYKKTQYCSTKIIFFWNLYSVVTSPLQPLMCKNGPGRPNSQTWTQEAVSLRITHAVRYYDINIGEILCSKVMLYHVSGWKLWHHAVFLRRWADNVASSESKFSYCY